MVEEWKTIDGTDGKYSVSTLGQVRCNGYSFSAFNGRSVCTINHKQRILNGSLNKWGYVSVDICGKTRLVHRLVATAFIDNPEDKPCINHIDGNKKNNSVSNLEWVTVKENNLHAIETGLRPSGDRYPHSKLTSEQVKEIRMNHVPGKVGTGCKILARKYGVHHSVIQNIINGKKWRHEDGSSI